LQGLEPSQGKASRSPHTLKTLKTLSNSDVHTFEREKSALDPDFRTWLDKKASRLPRPPVLREQWIAKQAMLEVNQRQFQAERQKAKSAPASPPEQFQVEFACLAAIQAGDRQFAAAKLSAVLAQGNGGLAQAILQAQPDWGFELCNGQLVDQEA
jgi:hypothetical protein